MDRKLIVWTKTLQQIPCVQLVNRNPDLLNFENQTLRVTHMWNDVKDEIVSGLNWLYKYVRLIRLVFKSFYHYRVAKRSAVTLCVNISLSHVSYKTGTNKRRRQCRRIVAMVPWYLRQNTRFKKKVKLQNYNVVTLYIEKNPYYYFPLRRSALYVLPTNIALRNLFCQLSAYKTWWLMATLIIKCKFVWRNRHWISL